MLRKLTAMLVLAALGLCAPEARAFFENTGVSPRARGMGESAVAVPGGPYAAFFNPGLLASGAGAAGASYVRPFRLEFTDFLTAGAVMPLAPRYGAVGFGVSDFKVSYQGVDLLKETQIALAHGITVYQDVHSRVDLGWGLNVYRVEQSTTVTGYDPGSDTVLGVDFGMAMTLHKRTVLGFLIKNLNNPQIGIDEEELNKRLLAGVSYQPYDGVTTTFEFANQLGQDVQYHGGVEMAVLSGLCLRAGVVTNPEKVTAGFGYTVRGVTLDYGFNTGGGTLDGTHHFGLTYAWGGEAQ